MKKIFSVAIISIIIICNLNSQDLLIKIDKSILEVKVTEIGENKVKYKKYSNLSGPIYNINKSEIFLIKYENGDEDSFTNLSGSNEIKASSISDTNIAKPVSVDKFLDSNYGDLSGKYLCTNVSDNTEFFPQQFEIALKYRKEKKSSIFQFSTSPENSAFHKSQEFKLNSTKVKKNKLSRNHIRQEDLPNFRYRTKSTNDKMIIEYVLYFSNGYLVYNNGIHPTLFSLQFYKTENNDLQVATFFHANDELEWLDNPDLLEICNCKKM